MEKKNEINLKSKTEGGQKLEKDVKKGLDGFSLMFASAIKYDELDKAIKSGALDSILNKL